MECSRCSSSWGFNLTKVHGSDPAALFHQTSFPADTGSKDCIICHLYPIALRQKEPKPEEARCAAISRSAAMLQPKASPRTRAALLTSRLASIPSNPGASLVFWVPTLTQVRAAFSPLWWTFTRELQGQRGFRRLGVTPHPYTPSMPHHPVVRAGYGTRASGHRFQTIWGWQVYLTTARDPYVLFNQPCLIFTSLPFLVCFQTSLPSTLDFFVHLRSWYFQGLNGSCTTLSEGSKTSAWGVLVWAHCSYGD